MSLTVPLAVNCFPHFFFVAPFFGLCFGFVAYFFLASFSHVARCFLALSFLHAFSAFASFCATVRGFGLVTGVVTLEMTSGVVVVGPVVVGPVVVGPGPGSTPFPLSTTAAAVTVTASLVSTSCPRASVIVRVTV